MLFRKKNRVQFPQEKQPEVYSFLKSKLRGPLLQLASILTKAEKKLTIHQKMFVITGFCFVTGLMSMATLYRGLYEKNTFSPSYLKTPSISIPVSPQLPDSILYRWRSEHIGKPNQKISRDSISK